MNNTLHTVLLSAAGIMLLFSCGGGNGRTPVAEEAETVVAAPEQETVAVERDMPQDIDRLTMQELRLLRSSILARHGVLFAESDLRRYWREYAVWYDTLSRAQTIRNGYRIYEPELPEAERSLTDRIERRMLALQRDNYITSENDCAINVLNIVNLFPYAGMINQPLMDGLAVDSHASEPAANQQLFQVYRENDSLQLPNFVTADLLLQLVHLYYACMLRTVEEERLAPMLSDLCLAVHRASVSQAGKEKQEEIRQSAYYNAAFFAVAYTLLTGKQLKTPGTYQAQIEEELAYIAQQTDHVPSLLPLKTPFPYSAFQPYGHYTRTAALRRYYKALRWLQLAPCCMSDKKQLQQTVMLALSLQSDYAEGTPAATACRRFLEAVGGLTGQPAYLSISDICAYLQKERITGVAAALLPQNLNKVAAMAVKAAAACPGTAKYPATCKNAVFFVPQPYFAGDEVLQNMTDQTPGAERAFPKVSDVFAAFGSQTAFNKLFLDNQEDTLWTLYPSRLKHMRDKVRQNREKDHSLYGKWMECLLALQEPSPDAPPFLRTRSWERKNMTTASASWVKWKHDMLLYGNVPDHPEALPDKVSDADSLPPPVTVGYVEPNVLFWKKLREWVEMTEDMLNDHALMTAGLQVRSGQVLRYVSFMEDMAGKQSRNEIPDAGAYRFIAHIGDSIEQLSLSMIDPPVDRWQWTEGTDRQVAVTEKIFARNVTGCPRNGVLYAVAGNVRLIYVVAEINGYLYLTRGATFGYDEFVTPEE
ncbi:MAG: DUF3160 domain-containing protein [Bacteroidales bacterium]|jgi:hypothetical protein|nr:DUF3160 domain-containing protein [Bacteroidales bacterium]